MKKTGFTLAEVLITLVIIGVVAAITLPPLVQNYKKKAWTTQLQKSYSLLNQGFQKMLADDDVDNLSDTSVWRPIVNNNASCNYSYWKSSPVCSEVVENLNKYFKIIGMKTYDCTNNPFVKFMNGASNYCTNNRNYLALADGTVLDLSLSSMSYSNCSDAKSNGSKLCPIAGEVRVDINGDRGPNILGRDVFYFYISAYGKLYPYGGRDYALWNRPKTSLDSNGSYWRNNPEYCGAPEGSNTGYPASESTGEGCAARIMENGWKMDY